MFPATCTAGNFQRRNAPPISPVLIAGGLTMVVSPESLRRPGTTMPKPASGTISKAPDIESQPVPEPTTSSASDVLRVKAQATSTAMGLLLQGGVPFGVDEVLLLADRLTAHWTGTATTEAGAVQLVPFARRASNAEVVDDDLQQENDALRRRNFDLQHQFTFLRDCLLEENLESTATVDAGDVVDMVLGHLRRIQVAETRVSVMRQQLADRIRATRSAATAERTDSAPHQGPWELVVPEIPEHVRAIEVHGARDGSVATYIRSAITPLGWHRMANGKPMWAAQDTTGWIMMFSGAGSRIVEIPEPDYRTPQQGEA